MKTAHFLSIDEIAEQNLALAELDETFNFNQERKVEQVMIHASQAISETIMVTLDSANGSNYDTKFQDIVLVGETDYIWRPQGECNLKKGDKLRVQCTNANGVGIIYAAVKTSEL